VPFPKAGDKYWQKQVPVAMRNDYIRLGNLYQKKPWNNNGGGNGGYQKPQYGNNQNNQGNFQKKPWENKQPDTSNNADFLEDELEF
jgi:hypothetical protein